MVWIFPERNGEIIGWLVGFLRSVKFCLAAWLVAPQVVDFRWLVVSGRGYLKPAKNLAKKGGQKESPRKSHNYQKAVLYHSTKTQKANANVKGRGPHTLHRALERP